MDTEDLKLIREKHTQLDRLLPKLKADAWLIPCREENDRAAPLLAGFDTIGETILVFTRQGKKIAIVTDYDQHDAKATGVYDEVIPCSQGFAEPLRDVIKGHKLKTFAMNYSEDDALMDGLSYGLLLRLKKLLDVPDFESRLMSAQGILEPLRAQKSPEEIRRIREAIRITETILYEVDVFLKPTMSEREIVSFIKERQRFYQTSSSFGDGANVMAGRYGIGHRAATDKPITAGDTLLIDMGCFYKGYTSDIQRAYYVLDNEGDAPAQVQHRYQVGQDAMHQAIAAIKPGKKGHEIDAIARYYQQDHGIKPFPHALGHQIGRTIHDGGSLLAPIGPRYGQRGNVPLAVHEVYTVEPVVHGQTDIDGCPIGVEQDILITQTGAELLSQPQERLILIG